MAQRSVPQTLPLWRSVGVAVALLACLPSCSEDDANSGGDPGIAGTSVGGNGANTAATGGNLSGLGGSPSTTGGSPSTTGGSPGGTAVGTEVGAGGSVASTGGSAATATGGSATSAAASEFVTATNAVRAAVTEPAGYNKTWTPLPNVTWSDAVAASAQAWADHLAQTNNCGLEHESPSTYGENLAAGSNLSPTAAVNMWAGEKNLYTWSAKYTINDFNAGSGHYTQLVWRTSVQIGCGSATCGRSVVISCRYSPPGNMLGSSVY